MRMLYSVSFEPTSRAEMSQIVLDLRELGGPHKGPNIFDAAADHILQLETELENTKQHARDSRFLLAALIKKAGGRIEIAFGEVIAIDANASIVTWDDAISGRKVWMLQTLTQASDSSEHG